MVPAVDAEFDEEEEGEQEYIPHSDSDLPEDHEFLTDIESEQFAIMEQARPIVEGI